MIMTNKPETITTNADELLKVQYLITNPASSRDSDSIQELAQSIRTFGQLKPITLNSDFDGYQIIDGFNRVEACKLLGIDVIATVVNVDEKQSLLMRLTLNTHQRKMNGYEKFDLVQKLSKTNATTQEIKNALGWKYEQRVYDMKNIAKFPELIDSLKTNKLELEQCVVIAKALGSDKPVDPVIINRVVDYVGKVIKRVPQKDTVVDHIKELEINLNRAEMNEIKNIGLHKKNYYIVFDKFTPLPKLTKHLAKAEKAVEELKALIALNENIKPTDTNNNQLGSN